MLVSSAHASDVYEAIHELDDEPIAHAACVGVRRAFDVEAVGGSVLGPRSGANAFVDRDEAAPGAQRMRAWMRSDAFVARRGTCTMHIDGRPAKAARERVVLALDNERRALETEIHARRKHGNRRTRDSIPAIAERFACALVHRFLCW